jgi:hypothetical protein
VVVVGGQVLIPYLPQPQVGQAVAAQVSMSIQATLLTLVRMVRLGRAILAAQVFHLALPTCKVVVVAVARAARAQTEAVAMAAAMAA